MPTWQIPLIGNAFLEIEVAVEDAIHYLEAREARLRDMGPALAEVARYMREAIGARFAEGGDPPWQQLAISTVLEKRGAGLPARTKKGNVPWRLKQQGQFGAANILIRTGALRDSYRRKGGRGHIENIDTAANTVEVGSSLPYARFHQHGTSPYIIRAKMGKRLSFMGSQGVPVFRHLVNHPGLPARPVLLTDKDLAEIARIIESYICDPDSAVGAAIGSGAE